MCDVLNRPRTLTATSRLVAVAVSVLALLCPATASADASGGWQRLRTTPTPSARQAATLCYDPISRRTLLFGGFANASPDEPSRPLSDTWAFAGHGWGRLAPNHAPAPRAGASCAWDGHELLLYGGSRRYGSADMYDDTWTWTGTDWRQLHPADSPGARAPAAYGYDGNHLVLFGGWNPETSQRSDGRFGDTWIWQDGDWRQEVDAVNPGPRSGSGCATWTGHGLLLNGGSRNIPLNDTWIHTAHGWRQLQAAGGNSPYAGSAAPLGPDVLIYTGAYQHPTWLWHNGRWKAVAGTEPPQTFGAPAAELGPDAVVMFGGYPPDAHTTYATTYIYRPSDNRPASQPRRTLQPPARPSPHPSPARVAPRPVASTSASPLPTATAIPSRVAEARPITKHAAPGRLPAVLLALTALFVAGFGTAWASIRQRHLTAAPSHSHRQGPNA